MNRRLACTLLAVLLLVACAGLEEPAADAEGLLREGRYEEALDAMKALAERSPPQSRHRSDYLRLRENILGQLLAQADNARIAGDTDSAERLYQRALRIDPPNVRAAQGLELSRREARYGTILLEAEKRLKAGDLDGVEAALRPIFAEDPAHRGAQAIARLAAEERVKRSTSTPTLHGGAKKTVTLEFRDVALRSVFEVLTGAGGINFVFDRDIRPDLKTTIFVKEATIEKVIEMLLVTNQLAKKVMDERTILIYPSTPQKQREYQELVVKAFYLVNADVRQTLNLIRTILKTRDVFVDEKVGLLVMRDTAEAVRLAEKLIAAQDLAEPEVVLQVEVLEVSRSKLLELGVRWPDQVAFSLVGGGAAGSGTPGQLTLPEWLNRGSELVRINVTNPFFIINMRQQDADTNLLANPRIRVKNREKAKVHIGDRVPVITSTATTGGFVSQSVTYLDVGLKLDVEALVALVNDVQIRVGLEVSNIVREVTSTGASGNILTYQIGTRNASTVLRLRDGETQILAGLISDEDRRAANRVPSLGELPVVGRLFSSQLSNNNKSEIVLLITPHVVRNLARPDATITEFASGTEAAIGGGPTGGAPVPIIVPGPAAPQPGTPGAPGVAPRLPRIPPPVAPPAPSPFTPVPAPPPIPAPVTPPPPPEQ